MNALTLIALATTLIVCGNIAHSADDVNGAAQASLSDHDVFQVSAFLEGDEEVVVRQNVKLTIETATSGWFTGGTRITLPEIPGLLILQNEKFASNASERRGGNTWVIQRWTLDVYPLEAGTYFIPPLEMTVKMKTTGGVEILGTVKTSPTSISATLPPALKGIDEWVAAPDFFVRQTFDRPLESLAVGDAIEQTIEFGASDVMAMMLPVYKPESLTGLAAYPLPPVIENTINRGQNSATRIRRISYIIEQPGQFTLPAQDYFWWNTRSQQLELVTLPAVTLSAGGSSANADASPALPMTGLRAGQFATAALLIGLLGWMLIYLGKNASIRNRIKHAVDTLRNALRQIRRHALPDKLNP